MVEILDHTKTTYRIQPTQAVQQLLRRVPESDLAGLDAIVLQDEDELPKGDLRLSYYRLARPTGNQARQHRKTNREIVLLIGPILRKSKRPAQNTLLLASTLFQQIGYHRLAQRSLTKASTRKEAEARRAEQYADSLLWPFLRQQVLRWMRWPALLAAGALALGIIASFLPNHHLATALVLVQLALLVPVLLLGAGGAFLPSTKRMVRPILLLWIGLVWLVSAVIAAFSSGSLQTAFASGLALFSLTLGLATLAAGGITLPFWWTSPIGAIRPPLAVGLFGLGLLAGVAPFLHSTLAARAAIAQASALWALIGAASVALAIALGWWLFADLRQDALELAATDEMETT